MLYAQDIGDFLSEQDWEQLERLIAAHVSRRGSPHGQREAMLRHWHSATSPAGRMPAGQLVTPSVAGADAQRAPELTDIEEVPQHRAPPIVDMTQVRHGVLWVTDLAAAEWCSLQTTFQVLSGKAKEETEAMKEGTAVHEAREAEVVSRISVEVTSSEDKRALRVLNMIVQLRQLVTEGRTREVELFAKLRPGDPWLFGKLDEAAVVQHKGQPVVQLIEIKTRKQPNLPRDGQTRNACLQVLMYHRMYEHLRAASVAELREFLLGEGRSKRNKSGASNPAALAQAEGAKPQMGAAHQPQQQPMERDPASLAVPWPLLEPSPQPTGSLVDHASSSAQQGRGIGNDTEVATGADIGDGSTRCGGSSKAGDLSEVAASEPAAPQRRGYLDPCAPLGDELQQQCSLQLPDHPLAAQWRAVQQRRLEQAEQQRLRQQQQELLASSLPWPLPQGSDACPTPGTNTPAAQAGASSSREAACNSVLSGTPAVLSGAAGHLTPFTPGPMPNALAAGQGQFKEVLARADDASPEAATPAGPWNLEALINYLHSAVLPVLPPAAPGTDDGPGHLVRYWYHGRPSSSARHPEAAATGTAPPAATVGDVSMAHASAVAGVGAGPDAGVQAGGGMQQPGAGSGNGNGNIGAGFLSPDVEIRHAEWSPWLDYTSGRLMEVLAGRLEPSGVEREENWKCRYCKFRAPLASGSTRRGAAAREGRAAVSVGAKRQAEGLDVPGIGQTAAQGDRAANAVQSEQVFACTWPGAR